MVVEFLNLSNPNKKSYNIHPNFHQSQPQYDNNLYLLGAR